MIINSVNLTTTQGWRTLEVVRPGIGQELLIEPTARRLSAANGYNTAMLINGRKTPPGRLIVRGHVIGSTAEQAATRLIAVLNAARGNGNGLARISLPGHTLDADYMGYLEASGTEVTGAVARRNTKAYAVTLSFLLPDQRRIGLTTTGNVGPQLTGALANSVGPVPLIFTNIGQVLFPEPPEGAPDVRGVRIEIRTAGDSAVRWFEWRRWPALPTLGIAEGPSGGLNIDARAGTVTIAGQSVARGIVGGSQWPVFDRSEGAYSVVIMYGTGSTFQFVPTRLG